MYKTLLFVVTSVPLKVTVGVLLAFFFSTPLIWGRKIWRALLLVPWALPILLSGMTWRIMFTPNKGPLAILFTGLTGHVFSIFANEWDAFLVYNLFEMWLAYPFIMTVTMGAIAGIPKEILEASYIDGAGVWLRFRKIMFPQVRGPVLFATILTTGASLQAFMVPLLINGGGPTGEISIPGLTPRTGNLNEMMVLFGYDRARFDQLYGYASAVYIVLTVFLIIYIIAWMKVTRMGRGRQ
jgi:arabinogalactan oligomer/maltooligosaccharide transport system permease protein